MKPGAKTKRLSFFDDTMTTGVASALVKVVLIGIVTAYCWPFFFARYANNLREIYSYSLDSLNIVRDIKTSALAHHFRLDFTSYGQLYYNASILTTHVYSFFSEPTDAVVIFIARAMSLLGGVLTIIMLFVFARRFLGAGIGLFCAASLTLTPVAIEWCTEPHPDTLQMFFVTLSLYLLVRSMPGAPQRSGSALNLRFIWASAMAAGAAFSTKYIGFLLLPFIVLAILATPLNAISARSFRRLMRFVTLVAAAIIVPLLAMWLIAKPHYLIRFFPPWNGRIPADGLASIAALVRVGVILFGLACVTMIGAFWFEVDLERWQAAIRRVLIILGVLAIFCLTFAITSPWAVWRMQFLPELLQMGAYVNFGHGVRAHWYGFRWISLLAGADGLSPFMGILSLVGMWALVLQWKAQKFRIDAVPFIFVAGWTLFFVAFMILKINLVKSSYLLPTVPAAILLAGMGLVFLGKTVAAYLKVANVNLVISAAAVLFLCGQALITIPALASFQAENVPDQMPPAKLAMAEWLVRCVTPEKRIMTAAYSYIPPSFANAYLNTDQGGYARFVDFAPDVVILNKDDIVFFKGALENSATTFEGTSDDKVLYFNTVAHSAKWNTGPSFGLYTVYVKPALRSDIETGHRDCFK